MPYNPPIERTAKLLLIGRTVGGKQDNERKHDER